MDSLLVPILALLAVLVGAWWWMRSRGSSSSSGKPSRRRKEEALDTLVSWHPQATRVLTSGERKAYVTLRAALPEHILLAQVPLARFLKVPTRHSYSEWSRRVGSISADILVCDSASQVVAVIEIRGDSGESDRAKQRQERMSRVLQAAGIPLYVWREAALPSVTVARSLILKDSDSQPPELARQPGPNGEKIPLRNLRTPAQAPNRADDDSQLEPPSSTWFDDLGSQPAPLTPQPPPYARGSGPSIR
jgi:Protein of unknown function (DUF2726)